MSAAHTSAKRLAKSTALNVLGDIRKVRGTSCVRSCPTTRIRFKDHGIMEEFPEEKLNWTTATILSIVGLEQSPQFAELTSALECDPLFGPRMNAMIGTMIESRRLTGRTFLQTLLGSVLERCRDDLKLSDQMFEEAWDATSSTLLATHVSTKYWCILENVEIPGGSTEVLPDMCLRGLSIQEVEDWWNGSRIVQSLYPVDRATLYSIMERKTLLETTHEELVVVGDGDRLSGFGESPFASVQSAFDAICTSIRLIRAEPVIMSPTIVESTGLWESSQMHGSADWGRRPSGGKCQLSESDVHELQTLLAVVSGQETNVQRATRVCLQRMNMANMRASLEDKLIDTCIALEATVLSDSGDRGELSFRMSIRLARFLGSNSRERKDLFQKSKRAYDLRSTVVHGRELKPSDRKLIPEFLEIARRATRKYLQTLDERPDFDWNSMMFD